MGPVTINTVNVWQNLDKETKEFSKKLSLSSDSTTNFSIQEAQRTETAVCEHCFRSFGNLKLAELHEKTCDRNPDR